ncbi:hypothetical protein EG829_01345 [bacterium]|nr:hypothetical protein [bacterium]
MKKLSTKIMSLGSYLAELALYACFVFAYFFLVLHFLDDSLKKVFDANKTLYAFLALALIIVQGVLLEMMTSALLKVIQRKLK